MDIISWDFLSLVLIVFAVVMVLAGIFSAYFGKGKNRVYGILITVIGLVVALIMIYLLGWSDVSEFRDIDTWDMVYNAIVNLIGVIIGALVAVGIFLVTVLKS